MKGMGFIYALLSFITFPMFYIMTAVEYAESAASGYRYNGFEGIPEIYTPVTAVLYFALVICGAVLISVFINSFMHNRRAVDVFHALPVKRGQQLMANFAAVVTLLLGVQFFCYGVVAVVNSFIGFVSFGDIVMETLRVALLTVLIVVIAFFCSVCCNAGLDSAMFTGAFLIIVPAYTLLVVFLMENFVTGFYGEEQILVDSLVFSPAAMLWKAFIPDEDLSQGVLLNAIYSVIAVAVVYLTCRLYVKRKSEMAQSASTKNPLYQFMLLAASVGGGVFFGFFYDQIFGRYGQSVMHIMLTSCLFTVAIYLVFNAIVSRNPRPTKRGLLGLGASLALVVAFLLIADNGFFGYETHIPSDEDIHSATINYVGDYGDVSVVEPNSYGDYLWYNSNNEVTFTDSEGIAAVKAAHRAIAEAVRDGRGTECFRYSTKISYVLKNGRTVSRRYYSIPSSVIPVFVEMEDMQNFKTQLYPVFWADAKDVKNFEIKDGYGENYQLLRNLTDSEKAKLYNAIAQDTINITRQMKDQRKGAVFARIQINYNNDKAAVAAALAHHQQMTAQKEATEETTVELAAPHYAGYSKEKYDSVYTNVVFDVTQDCINTIRVLTELGLEQYTQFTLPQDKFAVVMPVYFSFNYDDRNPYWRANTKFDQYEIMDNLRWEDMERIALYTDEQKIDQLAKLCQTSLYMPAQKYYPYAVAFIDKDADWREIDVKDFDFAVYYMSDANAPDFVKKDLADFAGQTVDFLSFSNVE